MMPEALDPEIIMKELPDEGIPIYVEQRRVEPPSRFPLPKNKKESLPSRQGRVRAVPARLVQGSKTKGLRGGVGTRRPTES
jgi:hypothetical protein